MSAPCHVNVGPSPTVAGGSSLHIIAVPSQPVLNSIEQQAGKWEPHSSRSSTSPVRQGDCNRSTIASRPTRLHTCVKGDRYPQELGERPVTNPKLAAALAIILQGGAAQGGLDATKYLMRLCRYTWHHSKKGLSSHGRGELQMGARCSPARCTLWQQHKPYLCISTTLVHCLVMGLLQPGYERHMQATAVAESASAFAAVPCS